MAQESSTHVFPLSDGDIVFAEGGALFVKSPTPGQEFDVAGMNYGSPESVVPALVAELPGPCLVLRLKSGPDGNLYAVCLSDSSPYSSKLYRLDTADGTLTELWSMAGTSCSNSERILSDFGFKSNGNLMLYGDWCQSSGDPAVSHFWEITTAGQPVDDGELISGLGIGLSGVAVNTDDRALLVMGHEQPISSVTGDDRFAPLERFQEKCVRFSGSKMLGNNKLEHIR